MSTTTKDRAETAETTAEDRLPYHPEDWPEEFRAFLDRLPDVDQELSDIISEMEGLLALADTSLLIYMNARNIRSGDSEAGKLDYRKARMISPMREETAKFVWQVYRRVDAFYDLLQEYECEAQEEALRLAAARNGKRENGGRPHLTLDEEADRDFAFILLVISYLGVVDIRDSDKLRRQVLGKISVLADNLLQQLEEQPGMESLFEDLQEEADRRASEIKQELAGDAVKPEGAPGDASGNISGSDRGGAS